MAAELEHAMQLADAYARRRAFCASHPFTRAKDEKDAEKARDDARAALEAFLSQHLTSGVMDMEPWRLAIDTALVDSGLDCTTASDDPATRVRELIEWTRTVALDPSVSAEAQALIDRGTAGVQGTLNTEGKNHG